MIRAVFFDAGDTILRPHPSFAELFASVCRGAGRVISPEQVAEVQERLAPHLVDLVEETDGDVVRYLGSTASDEQSRRFWHHLYRRFLAELGEPDEGLSLQLLEVFSRTSSYKLFDDVAPTIARLEELGLRLGLISNFERWLEELLVELDVGRLFDVVVISGLEGVEKPDPAIYRLALHRAGLGPEEAVHVGDSPANDVEPALAVGMQAILLDRYRRYEGVDHPRIESLEELPDVVLKM